jgi:hypothetical protein
MPPFTEQKLLTKQSGELIDISADLVSENARTLINFLAGLKAEFSHISKCKCEEGTSVSAYISV